MKRYCAELKAFDSKLSAMHKIDKYRRRFMRGCRELLDKENMHPNIQISKEKPSPKGKARSSSRKKRPEEASMKRGKSQGRVPTISKAPQKATRKPVLEPKQLPILRQRLQSKTTPPAHPTITRLFEMRQRCGELAQMLTKKEQLQLQRCNQYYLALRGQLQSMRRNSAELLEQQYQKSRNELQEVTARLTEEIEHQSTQVNEYFNIEYHGALPMYDQELEEKVAGLEVSVTEVQMPQNYQSICKYMQALTLSLTPIDLNPKSQQKGTTRLTVQDQDLLCEQNLLDSSNRPLEVSFQIDTQFIHGSNQPLLIPNDTQNESPGVSPSFKPF